MALFPKQLTVLGCLLNMRVHTWVGCVVCAFWYVRLGFFLLRDGRLAWLPVAGSPDCLPVLGKMGWPERLSCDGLWPVLPSSGLYATSVGLLLVSAVAGSAGLLLSPGFPISMSVHQ